MRWDPNIFLQQSQLSGIINKSLLPKSTVMVLSGFSFGQVYALVVISLIGFIQCDVNYFGTGMLLIVMCSMSPRSFLNKLQRRKM